MLDPILNINPQEKYKSGSKITSNQFYSVNRYDQEKHHDKDSARFSPLAKLMSKLNWKILSVQYPSDDEMLFHILINDLEFITVIDFRELYSKSFQEFSIIKNVVENGKKIIYEVKLEIEKEDISILDKSEEINIDSILELYERVLNKKIYSQNNIIEPYILHEIVNGLQYNLNTECNNILKAIYTFISTRDTTKIKNNFILKTHKNIPIMLNKVSIIYAD